MAAGNADANHEQPVTLFIYTKRCSSRLQLIRSNSAAEVFIDFAFKAKINLLKFFLFTYAHDILLSFALLTQRLY
ncbi:hypothetical protein SDC9_209794 [bioreactor metagenome]|uniref:Uncharacterized protein n=1 Tax=bioreactor metagenome TaxID=1076179 RepID=A0A645JE93_9ZZZZ